jgi:hypothetical protein
VLVGWADAGKAAEPRMLRYGNRAKSVELKVSRRRISRVRLEPTSRASQ